MKTILQFDVQAFTTKHGRPPNAIIMNREAYFDLVKYIKSKTAPSSENIKTFNGLKIIKSEFVEKDQIIFALIDD